MFARSHQDSRIGHSSKRLAKKSARRMFLESLEPRMMLATVSFENGVITAVGSGASETFKPQGDKNIDLRGSILNAGTIQFATAEIGSALGSFKHITSEVHLGAGTDRVVTSVCG